MFNFTSHEEIPFTVVGYIVNVADVDDVSEIPVEDINEFLNELEEHIDAT